MEEGALKEIIGNKQLLCIIWSDSFGASGGWQSIEEYSPDELEVVSVGIKVFENEKVVALAPNYAQATTYTSEQANGLMVIPKCCISEIIFLAFCQPTE